MTQTQTRKYAAAVAVLLALGLTGRSGGAQAVPIDKQAQPTKPLIPLQVTVVISRYQGERADKRVGTLPFTLRVNANDRPSALRMSSDVPVPTTTFSKEAGMIQSFQLRNIGTNIDCAAESADGGRYVLNLTVNDSQVNPPVKDAGGNVSLGFQAFSSSHRLLIRDGETIQQTAATDKATGETIKVEVTLNVVK